ncbi:TonB-dependent siderophore receptor, partial [Neisseria sp. P0001.S006]
TYEINPDYSALFTSDRDRSKSRDQDFSLTLDGHYPALGRSHEFNAGISYQDNKENLSFYEEGESTIPDLRKFDGNIAK